MIYSTIGFCWIGRALFPHSELFFFFFAFNACWKGLADGLSGGLGWGKGGVAVQGTWQAQSLRLKRFLRFPAAARQLPLALSLWHRLSPSHPAANCFWSSPLASPDAALIKLHPRGLKGVKGALGNGLRGPSRSKTVALATETETETETERGAQLPMQNLTRFPQFC